MICTVSLHIYKKGERERKRKKEKKKKKNKNNKTNKQTNKQKVCSFLFKRE